MAKLEAKGRPRREPSLLSLTAFGTSWLRHRYQASKAWST